MWARQVADLLAERGRPADRILREVALNRAHIESPEARIPFATHVALLEAAARHLNDPCFGLHFGASLDPLDAGAIVFLAANSPTLGEALQNFTKYMVTATEGVRARLEQEEHEASLVVEITDANVERDAQYYEFALSAALNTCRFIVGRRITPASVEMRHPRSTNLEEFRRYFGLPVSFSARRYAIMLNRDLLAAPCRSADPRLFRIVKAYCDELLRQSNLAKDFREEVELLIGSLLPTGTATTANVASRLGMSERTLSRRLAEEGVTFRQMIETQRRRMAIRYLGDPAFRPAQIAYLLGYSEPSTFSHAFKRWTGQSPLEYRTAQAG